MAKTYLSAIGAEFVEKAADFPNQPWRFWSLDEDAIADGVPWLGGSRISLRNRVADRRGNSTIGMDFMFDNVDNREAALDGSLRHATIRIREFFLDDDGTWLPTSWATDVRLSRGVLREGVVFSADL